MSITSRYSPIECEVLSDAQTFKIRIVCRYEISEELRLRDEDKKKCMSFLFYSIYSFRSFPFTTLPEVAHKCSMHRCLTRTLLLRAL